MILKIEIKRCNKWLHWWGLVFPCFLRTENGQSSATDVCIGNLELHSNSGLPSWLDSNKVQNYWSQISLVRQHVVRICWDSSKSNLDRLAITPRTHAVWNYIILPVNVAWDATDRGRWLIDGFCSYQVHYV